MAVSLSPNGTNYYLTPGPQDELLVATQRGIVTFQRSAPGAAWREVRRALEDLHIGSIAITGQAVFAGAHGGGVWASTDGGQAWERRDRGLEYDNVYALSFVQAVNELRLYAGTEPAHCYVSTDLGESWTELPALRDMPSVTKWTFPAPPHLGHVKTIAFHPADPDTMYVGVEVGGAFKSTDGGKTFRELSGFYVDVHRLMTTPLRPDEVYMSTGRGLYHSADRGESWKVWPLGEVGILYPDALVMQPDRPERLFTAGSSFSPGDWPKNKDADSRLAHSRDGGKTWQRVTAGIPSHLRGNVEAMTMNAHADGFALFAGTTDGDVFFSDDRGESWGLLAQSLPPVSKSGHSRALAVAAPRAT
jgi:photosystem II stability/assembly factor-like uncharacterized protein